MKNVSRQADGEVRVGVTGDAAAAVASSQVRTKSYVESGSGGGDEEELSGLDERRRALTLGSTAVADAPEALSAAVGDDLEELMSPRLGRKASAKLRRSEREATRGAAWYGMGAPEMTEELQRDLEVIQMRSAVDPKHFFKKNDHRKGAGTPRYFQVAQVVDDRADLTGSRSTSSARKKRSLVDELMADAEFQKYNKRKFGEIIKQQQQRTPGSKFRSKNK